MQNRDIIFLSDAYSAESGEVPELYSALRYVTITTEGPREHFFEANSLG